MIKGARGAGSCRYTFNCCTRNKLSLQYLQNNNIESLVVYFIQHLHLGTPRPSVSRGRQAGIMKQRSARYAVLGPPRAAAVAGRGGGVLRLRLHRPQSLPGCCSSACIYISVSVSAAVDYCSAPNLLSTTFECVCARACDCVYACACACTCT